MYERIITTVWNFLTNRVRPRAPAQPDVHVVGHQNNVTINHIRVDLGTDPVDSPRALIDYRDLILAKLVAAQTRKNNRGESDQNG